MGLKTTAIGSVDQVEFCYFAFCRSWMDRGRSWVLDVRSWNWGAV